MCVCLNIFLGGEGLICLLESRKDTDIRILYVVAVFSIVFSSKEDGVEILAEVGPSPLTGSQWQIQVYFRIPYFTKDVSQWW